MQGTAQGWLVYELTHDKMYLGTVAFANTLPTLLLSLPAGVMADRLSKRKITMSTQTCLAIQAIVLAALTFTGVIRPWHIVALASFSGLVNAIDIPARQAMTVELVGQRDLMNAVTLTSSAFNLARIAGPFLAGILIAFTGPSICFLINAISYTAVIGVLLAVRPCALGCSSSDVAMHEQILEGLAYARRNTTIRNLLLLTGFASVFGLQYGTLLPAVAKDMLHVDSKGLGILSAAAGLGAVLAAISVAALSHRFRPHGIVSIGSIIAPIGIIALSLSHSFPISVGIIVIVGFGMMMFLAVSNSIVQAASPDDLRGRILSVRSLVFIGFGCIGALLAGALAKAIGVDKALTAGGVTCLAAGVLFATYSARLTGKTGPMTGVDIDLD